MTPDPEFIAFFASGWQTLLDRAEVPGLADASWDRKAAYLFWQLRHERRLASSAKVLQPKVRDVNDGVVSLFEGS